MASRLEARLSKLEVQNPEPNPLEELNADQRRALRALIGARVDGEEVTDDLLWRNAMSRASYYEAALATISPELLERITSWAVAHG